jgi:DNA (cytosine-5)-methyltransferase 1
MRELSLFSGAGGGLLGTKLLGWENVGYVEFNDYCQRIIRQRILDGIFDPAPIFGDIRAFINEGYAESYKGLVDVITAGFPCQPFSVAGKQAGEDDPRNMWPQTCECIRIIRPPVVFLENVPGLLSGHGYYGKILGQLAESGYNVRWCCLSAARVGANHKRERLWILATDTQSIRTQGRDIVERTSELGVYGKPQSVPDTQHNGLHGPEKPGSDGQAVQGGEKGKDSSKQSEGVYTPGAMADSRSVGRKQRPSNIGADGKEVGRAESDISSQTSGEISDTDSFGSQGVRAEQNHEGQAGLCGGEAGWRENWWSTEPNVGRVANGVASRVDRLKAIGNGQVPEVVRTAWKILTEGEQ